MCLGSSRTFGHRPKLAGQSCRCWVGIAHSRSQVEVVGLREQLGGQECPALRYVHLWGGRYPSASH